MPWKEDWREATPCRFFRMGRCNQGERCPFQHSEQERKPGDSWCKDCRDMNFAWRQTCWKCSCGKKLPDQEEEKAEEEEELHRLEDDVTHWKNKAVKRGKERDTAERKVQDANTKMKN